MFWITVALQKFMKLNGSDLLWLFSSEWLHSICYFVIFLQRLQNSVYHFYTSPDASGLLIKIIWAYVNDTAKTFQGPGEEWRHCCQSYLIELLFDNVKLP